MKRLVALPMMLTALAASCRAGDEAGSPPGVPATFAARTASEGPDDVVSIRLSRGEMLVVQSERGTALLEFTEFGERRASYRWRARSPRGQRGRGTGSVAERYGESARSGDTVRLVDQGSELLVGAGVLTLLWSYADAQSAWLYVDTVAMKTRVLPAVDFETFAIPR